MSTGARSVRRWILPLCGILGALLIWETAVRTEFVRSVFLPAPSAVFIALIRNSEYVGISALVTLRDIAVGYVIGCVVGVCLGVLIGYYRSFDLALAPILLIVSPIPIVTFLPLFIIWFGLNTVPIFCCAAIAAFFPCLMSTKSGVQHVDYTLVEVAKNFGAGDAQILRKVILPAALPQISNGLRLSIQLSFLVTPVAEMIMGHIGLGGLIWRSADLFKTDLVLVGQFTLGAMGLSLYKVFDWIEAKYLLRWTRPENLDDY